MTLCPYCGKSTWTEGKGCHSKCPESAMTARQILEHRLGRKMAPTRQLAPDERVAMRRLGHVLVHENLRGAST